MVSSVKPSAALREEIRSRASAIAMGRKK